MARPVPAPIAVRAPKLLTFLAPMIVIVAVTGCSHKRTTLRPIYGTPVVAPPCNTPGCATSTTPMAPGGIITTEPEAEGGPILSPVPSTGSRSDDVIRAGGSPPPAPEAEPGLNDSGPSGSGSGTSSRPTGGIELNRPTAIKSTGRTAAAPSRTRRASLRQDVSAYLTDPSDLLQPGRADRPWKYVVLHHSAAATGGLDQIDREHRKVLGFDGCGYHFVIGNGTDSPDGQIEVASRWTNQKNGVHARNGKNPDVNENGIGICLVGNFDQSEPTPRQIAAARALVAYLADRYQIPADHLGTHDEFANGPTACPGQNFPKQAILGSKNVAAR